MILPSLSYSEIDQDAERVRANLGLGDGPVPDAAVVLERAGLLVFIEALPGGPDGVYLRRPEFDAVMLNAASYLPRFRFTAAHELAHSTYRDYEAHVDYDIFKDKSPIETRANVFAATFLMPKRGLAAKRADLGQGTLTPEDVARLATEFVVSYQAMVYRLHNLGHLDGAEHRDQLLLRRSASLTEQLREHRPPEGERLPSSFVQRAIDAYCSYDISLDRLAELLRADDKSRLAWSLREKDLLHPEDSGDAQPGPESKVEDFSTPELVAS